MREEERTRDELIGEIEFLRRRNAELEVALAKHPGPTETASPLAQDQHGPDEDTSEDAHLVDGRYSIIDLVDIDKLRSLFEKYSLATGFTTGLVAYPSQEVIIATGWRDICTKFHRAFPKSAEHCGHSNRYLTNQLKELREFNIRPCENGMMDGATPIIVKGKHIASLATGQVLFDKPDIGRFRFQAELYGYNVDEYLRALDQVPIVSENDMRRALSFLSELAVVTADVGHDGLRLRERKIELEQEIVERQRAEAALRESEERYRSLVENIDLGITLIGKDHRVLMANAFFGKNFGKRPEELIGKICYEEFEKRQAICPHCPGTRAMATGRPADVETEGIRDDGTRLPVRISAFPLMDAAGQCTGFIEVVEDIAERKQAEASARERVLSLRSILAASPVGIAMGQRKKIKWVNEAWIKMFGLSDGEEHVDHSTRIVYASEEEYGRVGHETCKDLEKGVVNEVDVKMVRKDGSVFDGRVRVTAFDPSDLDKGVIVVCSDISDRKRAEEELAKARALLCATIEQSPVGIIIADAPDVAIRFANSAALGIQGESSEPLTDIPSELHPTNWQCFHPDGSPVAQDELPLSQAVLHGRTTRNADVIIRRGDGEPRRLLANAAPVRDASGNIVAGVVVFPDITELRKAEEELENYRDRLEELVEERTRALEAAQEQLVEKERLAALGQLTATVSHEIRNPLGTVRTAVFSIGDALQRNETERIMRALKLAERNIVRCDRIIEELLDFTRVKVPNPKLTAIDGWLDEILSKQVIPEGIERDYNLNSGVELYVDRGPLRRAVTNVIANAVHALQEEGSRGNRLTVTTRVVEDRLEICIGDTGVGIPYEEIDRIFEPLFSAKGFGVGLGLPIVKNVMEQHGGGIGVCSQAGVGTTATLWLPIPQNG